MLLETLIDSLLLFSAVTAAVLPLEAGADALSNVGAMLTLLLLATTRWPGCAALRFAAAGGLTLIADITTSSHLFRLVQAPGGVRLFCDQNNTVILFGYNSAKLCQGAV